MKPEIQSSAPVWDQSRLANPHAVSDKRVRVQSMFSAIAPSYDLNNRLHSLWLDQSWRRRAVRLAKPRSGEVVVDVACGTGDLSLLFFDALHLDPSNDDARQRQVIGIDFTQAMLPLARRKSLAAGHSRQIDWLAGDAQALPLSDGCADIVSIAFGIRNVADPAAAIGEFYRVLRPGGRLVILEFGLPKNPLLRGFYNLYFRHVLPRTATWISHDRTGAYRYLPESVNTFIGTDALLDLLRQRGFGPIQCQPMTFGICLCYVAVKP